MLEIAGDAVHVWEAPLTVPAASVRTLFEMLSPWEQDRARKFVEDRGYNQYVISRAHMRQVLARYTGIDPSQIEFTIVGDGKPALAKQGHRKIFFNNTHSAQLGLIAVTVGREVGIDMEHIRELPRALQVSKRFFTPEEHESLLNLSHDDMIRAFLSIWTRREAGTKARGASVWRGLGSWKGSRMARRPGIIANESTEFTTTMLDLGPDYIGAVVAAGSGWSVQMRGPVTEMKSLTLTPGFVS